MTLLIVILVLIALFLALMCYACIIVSSDAERASEAYMEQKRIQKMNRDEPAENER